MKENQKELVSKILESVEGKKLRLAEQLSEVTGRKISPVTIYQWLKGTPINPNLCYAIQKITKGKVKVYQMRPDIFPKPSKDLPVRGLVLKGSRNAWNN